MTQSEVGTLVYLYGIVPEDAPEPPAELTGLDGGALRLVRAHGVAAVVSDVAAAEYGGESLDAHMGELAWVGERGLMHERVLDWYAERGPVLPLSLFSLHLDDGRIAARLEADRERFAAVLQGLRGRREWGVKLWRRDADAREHLDSLSPSLRAVTQEIEQAAPGRRFLLEKKRDAMVTEELRAVSRRLAHQVFAMLREVAERSASVPLPAGAPEGGRALLLHSAFLVPDAEFAGFHRRVSEVAHEVGGVGFELELTGPWPPYHFTEPDAG